MAGIDYTVLGRTGAKVSVLGLGGGGHSRLGMRTNISEQESARLVLQAVEHGVNLIDTAEAYGTEARIGLALRELQRDRVVLSTKYSLYANHQLKQRGALERSLDRSLAQLQTDYVDIYHLHAVKASDYTYATEQLVPELLKMRDKGKIRFLGITESFGDDPGHGMLRKAVEDDCWDVMMVGFNMLNQSARDTVFAATREKNIGVLDMFAVRRALANAQALAGLVADLIRKGWLEESSIDAPDPLGFLLHADGAASLTDAAYRYCRHEPGVHCVLSGTGNLSHLLENIRSVERPPLPEADLARIRRLFGALDRVTGNESLA